VALIKVATLQLVISVEIAAGDVVPPVAAFDQAKNLA
jgi:hypothetical protein